MTTGATNAGVSEVARQMFDLAAVAYRAEPSDANFWALASRRPEPDDRASLSEVAYEVARTLGFKLPVIGHLVNALGMEYRLSEAQHFCEAWLEQDPASKPGHRLAALIACESVDLPRARRALDKLEELGAETGTTLIVKTAMFLAFTDGSHAGITVRQALAASTRDAAAGPVALDVAHRLHDAQLLVDALGEYPTLSLDKRREVIEKKMLRTLLVELLAWHAEQAPTP